MNKLFSRQIAKATDASGKLNVELLRDLVESAYAQADQDRRRTDRSISLMIEELDGLNRGLEELVEERTAALRDREALLNKQNVLFEASLNNMSQGLCMFDADTRLMIFNRRYLEIYGLSPDRVKPGVSVKDLVEMRITNGTFKGTAEELVHNVTTMMARGETYSRFADLPDGRTIFTVSRPLAKGGWVVTHEDITERRRAERQIAHMAHHDALTDLPNRALFHERLETALAEVRHGKKIAVHYLDLDNFKGVNDTLGHQFGDELLKIVAARLRRAVRETDTVARVGGDEFAVIQTSFEDAGEIAALAAHICEVIGAPYDLIGHRVTVDTSIGLAIAPADGVTSDDLVKNADLALYRAKADGRGTFRFFEPEMDARVKARRLLENELRKAVTDGEFVLHYQPIVDLARNSIPCCEALVRWQHPQRGLVQPGEFISIAEETGLIIQLGEWVLRKACADATTWPDAVKVAVNLSPIQIMSPSLIPMVINALASAGLPASRLEIEITESVMMNNTEATFAALHRLHELGVKISMDDFGTGYSSLSYLRRFPFNKLKIDRCFINDLSHHDNAQAIVLAVNSMAKSLGIVTTAEGVETKEQLDQVRALGCTEVQGFYISRPMPLAQISLMIAEYAPRQRKSA